MLLYETRLLLIQSKVSKSVYYNPSFIGCIFFHLTSLNANNQQLIRLLLCVCVLSRSVVSDSLWPQGLQPARLLCSWNFPGKNTGVACHFLLQGIFPTQGSNTLLLHLLYWQVDFLPLRHLGSQHLIFYTRWHLKYMCLLQATACYALKESRQKVYLD